LYGNDPDLRPDIYGKIGNSGVSICCLDDAKKLYSGFDLSHPMTSVSMTINGPAPMLLGFFMNAAIDQNCEKYIKANGLEKEVETKIATIYKEKGGNMVEFLKENAEPIVDPTQYEVMKTNFAVTKTLSDEELKALETYMYSFLK
jgi:methylmalonyl-CoA mutase N-terminal domain/subunit